MLTLLRVLFGFVVACLVAGAVIVAFAIWPVEAKPEPLGNAGVLALLAATHSAIFAFPLALITIGIAEMWRLRSRLYYVVVGVLIAAAGFAAEYLNEVPGQPSIYNNYALAAFLTVGVLGGFTYWLLAGRGAGGRRGDAAPSPDVAPGDTDEPAPKTA